jgi:hypothetical protein
MSYLIPLLARTLIDERLRGVSQQRRVVRPERPPIPLSRS